MLNTIFKNLFSSNAIATAKAKKDIADEDVLKAMLTSATFNFDFKDPENIQAKIDTIRNLDMLLASYRGSIDYSWRCYISGCEWAVFKNEQECKITARKFE
jgi:hypothetical protein